MKKNLNFIWIFLLVGCQDSSNETLFSEVSNEIGIAFSNELTPTEEFNPYTFRSFYNGGGVAVGDVDNNGFQDIYFTGNLVRNQLYLNFGDWKFKEVALQAGVACQDVWSTGAVFADINQDGWLDLYVCKSGAPEGDNRTNSLFINNGDGTFTDQAEDYGLAIKGLSVQAAFFDYDKDGDLDCYVLTNSVRSVGTGADLKLDSRDIPDIGGNKLFNNDNGIFKDISAQAGIYSSAIGFGLGITLGDFNYDNWPDIFISNDFFERDYLYINNQDGSFTERAEDYFKSLSLGSMGADMADINNDGISDLLVTEMLPEDLARKKTKTMYESWNKHQLSVQNGFYRQYPRNMLHMGTSNFAFMEGSRVSGIANTDWSWGALLFDMDNDGLRDAFISNGIYRDLLDRDFLAFTANEANIRKLITTSDNAILQLLDEMPSKPIANSVFRNNGSLSFEKVSNKWGFSTPSFSNGSAYADLDNDHDLDLIVNNVNANAFVYKNNTSQQGISIKLIDSLGGPGIGAKVSTRIGDETIFQENFPVKGYQSASTPVVHIGVSSNERVDEIEVYWPSGKKNVLREIESNRLITIKEIDATLFKSEVLVNDKKILKPRKISNLEFQHRENPFVDFDKNNLLPEMYSNLGPRMACDDINNDGNTDFYFGAAKNQSGKLFISTPNGYEIQEFANESTSEDIDAVFFDVDKDGDLDLYVASGGMEFNSESDALLDKVYINNDDKFTIAKEAIPVSLKLNSSFVRPHDYDQDGDIDVLIGKKFLPEAYGTGGGVILLENELGVFTISDEHTFPEIASSNLITDAQWMDVNNDGLFDLAIVGEWSPIHLYINKDGSFQHQSSEYNLTNSVGWWNTIEVTDLDKDGYTDLIVGNKGINSFFKKGTLLNTYDFDKNGHIDNLISAKVDGSHYPVHDKDELIAHFPSLKKRAIYYEDYAGKTTEELFGTEMLNASLQTEIEITESCVFYGSENGFVKEELPEMAQLSPIYAVEVNDVNGDGWKDLIIGGNQYNVKPQFGSYDALNVTILYGNEDGFNDRMLYTSDIKGQIRDIEAFTNGEEDYFLFFINNDSIQIRSFY